MIIQVLVKQCYRIVTLQLVGTMNPEEGDLRPQLLDRFGLAVDVRGERKSIIAKSVTGGKQND